jgi:predicted unusual protein kinase regulating ubiquinone biosynthesis (AarF/ABC1/UbiB family)
VRATLAEDLAFFHELAGFMAAHTSVGTRVDVIGVIQQLERALADELDYRVEARNAASFRKMLAEFPRLLVPKVVEAYTTERVLTMERVHGLKVDAVPPIARLEHDFTPVAEELTRAYLKGITIDGFFHADPHPGNVFVVNGKIALIDLGMVAHLSRGLQDRLLQLLLAVADNRADDAAKTLLLLGERRENADQAAFTRGVTDIVAQHQQARLQRPQVGRAVLMLLRVAADSGIRLPAELAMVGKTLLNLDEIGHTLAPRFDPNAAIRRHAAEITEHQMARDLSLGALASAAVDHKKTVQNLPGRVNRILDRLADNEFQVKVDAIDETRLMEGMQKVANRISLGLVLAALIVGAALLMRVETSFRLFGYPGIAILLFLAAAAGGIALAVSILASDIRSRRKRPRTPAA